MRRRPTQADFDTALDVLDWLLTQATEAYEASCRGASRYVPTAFPADVRRVIHDLEIESDK